MGAPRTAIAGPGSLPLGASWGGRCCCLYVELRARCSGPPLRLQDDCLSPAGPGGPSLPTRKSGDSNGWAEHPGSGSGPSSGFPRLLSTRETAQGPDPHPCPGQPCKGKTQEPGAQGGLLPSLPSPCKAPDLHLLPWLAGQLPSLSGNSPPSPHPAPLDWVIQTYPFPFLCLVSILLGCWAVKHGLLPAQQGSVSTCWTNKCRRDSELGRSPSPPWPQGWQDLPGLGFRVHGAPRAQSLGLRGRLPCADKESGLLSFSLPFLFSEVMFRTSLGTVDF